MSSKLSLRRFCCFLAIAILGCALDLWTKSYFFERLGMPVYVIPAETSDFQREKITLIDGILDFQTHLNEGALFGIGQGRSFLFAALSLAAALGIIYWLIWLRAVNDWILSISLGCVMAGIFGNLYDRLGFHQLKWPEHPEHTTGELVYAVRDWIHFHIKAIGFEWPIFNIADMLLVSGACLLLLHAFFVKPETESKTQTA